MSDAVPAAASGSPPALEYAAAPSRRRRWLRRVVRGVLLLMVLVAPAAAYRYGPLVWTRARVLYYQRQCLTYSAAPETVVLDDGGHDASTSGGGAALMQIILGGSAPTTKPSTGVPACLASLTALHPAIATGASVGAPAGQALPVTGPLAFMHERVSAGGTRRLVVVAPECVHLLGPVLTVEPATAFRPPGKVTTEIVSARERILITTKMPRVRVFAGRPDPADRARFTIPFEEDGRRHAVDGVLNDDGTVTLSRRSDPPRPPGPRRLNLEVRELTVRDPSNAGVFDADRVLFDLAPSVKPPATAPRGKQ